MLAQDLDAFPKPYQLWIQIDGEDSSDDGVFIHSPSPHEPFPKSFEDVTWGEAELAAFFDGLLPGRHMAAGSTQREERTIYFVYAREVGESLADQGGT